MSDLQAVFWDMDGTLVDTEPYWIAAEHQLVAAHGGHWDDAQAESLVGQALTHSAAVLQQAGVAMDVDAIIDHLTAEVAARCAETIPWRPGARELLNDLNDSGVRCALVTMSYAPLAQAIAQALPEGHLEFVISGDMVTAGKPDPEAYHLGFSTMAEHHRDRTGEALDRSRCLVIEDSIPGTAAGVASGMVTLAVPHFAPLPESGAWHLSESLTRHSAQTLQALLRQPVGVNV